MKSGRVWILLFIGVLVCGLFSSDASAVLQEDQYQYGAGGVYYINGALKLGIGEPNAPFIGQYITPEMPWMGQVEFMVTQSNMNAVKLEVWGCDTPNGNPTILLASVLTDIDPIGQDGYFYPLVVQLPELLDVSAYYATAGGPGRLFISLVWPQAEGTEPDHSTGMLVGLHDIYKYTPPPGLGFDTYPEGEMRSGIPGSYFDPCDPNNYTRHPNYDAAFRTWGDLVVPSGKPCGSPGTFYFTADLNHDCYITLADFAVLAQDWMKYTDPCIVMALDQSNTGAGATGSPLHGYSESMWMAQTFQYDPAQSGNMVAVELYKTEWFNQFPAGTTIFAEIRLTTAGVPNATVLGRSEVITQEGGRNSSHPERPSMPNTQPNGYLGTLWAIAPYWEGWARWEFDPAIDITGYTNPGALAVVWGVEGSGAVNYSRGGNDYAGGGCFVNYDKGTTWYTVGDTDMAFTVYTGTLGTYLPTDLNKDSYVKLEDLALFVQDWLSVCSDPMNVDCDMYWRE